MKRVVVVLFTICVSLFSAFHSQVESAYLYYILDASGSMWGRVNGQMKIEAAKDAMIELMTQIDDSISSGLTVYGHKKKEIVLIL